MANASDMSGTPSNIDVMKFKNCFKQHATALISLQPVFLNADGAREDQKLT